MTKALPQFRSSPITYNSHCFAERGGDAKMGTAFRNERAENLPRADRRSAYPNVCDSQKQEIQHKGSAHTKLIRSEIILLTLTSVIYIHVFGNISHTKPSADLHNAPAASSLNCSGGASCIFITFCRIHHVSLNWYENNWLSSLPYSNQTEGDRRSRNPRIARDT